MSTTREIAEKTDRRKDGLSTKGYPLREIVSRENGVYVLSCGHVRPDPAKGHPVRSRRCPECAGADLPIYTQHQMDRAVANERERLVVIAESFQRRNHVVLEIIRAIREGEATVMSEKEK